jgi:predicted RNase H-like nuclease (RuvC/YqgF family)
MATKDKSTILSTADNLEEVLPVEETFTTIINNEVTALNLEIDALKLQIKEKQKRVRELTKKTAHAGPTKKEQALDWLKQFPESTMLEFINNSCTLFEISAVYATTLYKNFKKSQ